MIVERKFYQMEQAFYYKCRGKITSKVSFDYETNQIQVENYTDNILDTVFGCNNHPTMEDLNKFFESRCFPRTRDYMKLHLKELGLDYYDPISILHITGGKLEGDFYEIEFLSEHDLEYNQEGDDYDY